MKGSDDSSLHIQSESSFIHKDRLTIQQAVPLSETEHDNRQGKPCDEDLCGKNSNGQ